MAVPVHTVEQGLSHTSSVRAPEASGFVDSTGVRLALIGSVAAAVVVSLGCLLPMCRACLIDWRVDIAGAWIAEKVVRLISMCEVQVFSKGFLTRGSCCVALYWGPPRMQSSPLTLGTWAANPMMLPGSAHSIAHLDDPSAKFTEQTPKN